MKLAEVKELLGCRIISRDFDPNISIQFAYASDLMSDVLVFPKPGALLLTGLTNNQAIRTCKIAASCAIVFVRNKNPNDDTINLAAEYRIPLLVTDLPMFDACGILFANGLKGVPVTE